MATEYCAMQDMRMGMCGRNYPTLKPTIPYLHATSSHSFHFIDLFFFCLFESSFFLVASPGSPKIQA